jgi:hypothetical protein
MLTNWFVVRGSLFTEGANTVYPKILPPNNYDSADKGHNTEQKVELVFSHCPNRTTKPGESLQ